MREHWDEQAEEYAKGREFSGVDERVIQLIELKPKNRLLEIGVGSGITAEKILDKCDNINYFGLDLSVNFLKATKNRLRDNISYISADAAYPPFKAAAFDLILEMNSIHHFPKDIIPKVILDIAGLLKTGGRYISVEDWGAPVKDEREKLAHEMQKNRSSVMDGLEYHPTDEQWIEHFKNSSLKVIHLEHIVRPLNLNYYKNERDDLLQQRVRKLEELWEGEQPESTMSIFICEKL